MHPNPEQAPDSAAMGALHDSAQPDTAPYTGVVVIHGLGDAKRNDTLLESVNALTNWFNHTAGLTMRPAGTGRVWLTTQLVEDPDPDAPASRATIELEAPTTGDQPGDASPVRLRFREVWWAQSFGTQTLGTTIRWARVQFSEQVRHILVPVSWRYRFAHTAPPDPALATAYPAALVHAAPGQSVPSQPTQSMRARIRQFRPLLHVALGVYGTIQYAWKAVQWIALAPIVTLLLLLLAVLRVLSFIGIVKSALTATFTALTSYILLHWISSTEVYMRDYARAASIRGRFEHEFNAFQSDDQCERIVVIAHSMGTVIAYEALTLLSSQPPTQRNDKPITFICLAQALRRVWLLPGIDARRLYGTLPARVRWLNFWARYDPIPAGPLSIRSLPPLDMATYPVSSTAYAALCASLDRCDNVLTVNTDSSFTDHVTYYQNDEQVVGPIARELVAGHPAMERVVASHIATPEDVLLRRWDVAWRYSLALAGGLAAGIGVLVWLILSPGLVEFVTGLVRSINWSGLLLSVCPACQPLTTLPAPRLPVDNRDLSHFFALWYLLGQVDILAVVIGAVLVIGAATLGLQGVGHLAAKPSPLKAERASAGDAGGSQWVFLLSALTLVLALATSLVFTGLVGKQITVGQDAPTPAVTPFLLLLALAEVAAVLAGLVAALEMVANREWSWLGWMGLSLLLLYTFDVFYRGALLGVTIVAGLVLIFRLVRSRQSAWFWAVAVQLAIVLYLALDTLAADIGLVGPTFPGTGTYIDLVCPAFVYGLWTFARGRGPAHPRLDGAGGVILALAVVFLALEYALAVSRLGTSLVIVPSHGISVIYTAHLTRTSAPIGTLFLGDPRAIAAALIALLALALALFDAARHLRWGWLAIMLLVLAALGAVFFWLRVVIGVAPVLADDSLAFAGAPLSAALVYAMWAGSSWRKPAALSRDQMGAGSMRPLS